MGSKRNRPNQTAIHRNGHYLVTFVLYQGFSTFLVLRGPFTVKKNVAVSLELVCFYYGLFLCIKWKNRKKRQQYMLRKRWKKFKKNSFTFNNRIKIKSHSAIWQTFCSQASERCYERVFYVITRKCANAKNMHVRFRYYLTWME